MPEEKDILSQAQTAAQALKDQNDRMEKLINEQKKIEAERLMSGLTSGASVANPPPPREETLKEYKDRMEKEVREGKYNRPKEASND